MTKNKIYIKNMVCDRCVYVVKQVLDKLGIKYLEVIMGEIVLNNEENSDEIAKNLQPSLSEFGFVILDDENAKIVEEIRLAVNDYLRGPEKIRVHHKISEFLANRLNQEYSALSKLFSSMSGITIEKFLILQKIERVKELIFYDEFRINEISELMGYSSPAHLSSQFKNVTGMTPSQFKNMRDANSRISLEKL